MRFSEYSELCAYFSATTLCT